MPGVKCKMNTKKIILVFAVLFILLASGCTTTPPATDNNEDDETEDNPTPTPEETPEATPEATPEETPEETPEATPEVSPEETPDVVEPGEEGNLEMECGLITAQDILEVCGAVVTTNVKDEVENATVCSVTFEAEDATHSVLYTHAIVGGSVELQMSNCTDNLSGEAVGDYACFAPGLGNSVAVYGTESTAVIKNLMPMEEFYVCSHDQLKELGLIASSRIYE